MLDGYYLSTSLPSNKLYPIIQNASFQDKSITLWRKEASTVKLIRHWNLGKSDLTQQSSIPVAETGDSENIINELLSKLALSSDDMKEIWESYDNYTNIYRTSFHGFDNIPYQHILRLLPLFLSYPKQFYNEKIIILSTTDEKNLILNQNQPCSVTSTVYTSSSARVQMSQLLSPLTLWQNAKETFNLSQETLFELATACGTKLSDEKVVQLSLEESYESIRKYMEKLKDKIDNINFEEDRVFVNHHDPRFGYQQHKISMYMKILKEISIKLTEKIVDNILQSFKFSPSNCHFALLGNHPLNGVLIGHFMKKYRFKTFITPPSLNYANSSIAIGLCSFYNAAPGIELKINHFPCRGSKGVDYNIKLIESPLYSPYIHSACPLTSNVFVEDIAENPLIWFNSELYITSYDFANNCILIDPRNEKQRKTLNTIMQREWWRSVKAVILKDKVSEWYENPLFTPAVTQILDIKKDKLKKIPALAHLDTSASVEIITSELNPKLYECIELFENKYSIPILGKTSLQDSYGNAIQTVKAVIDFGIRKKFNVIYIDGKRIQLHNQDKYFNNTPLWI